MQFIAYFDYLSKRKIINIEGQTILKLFTEKDCDIHPEDEMFSLSSFVTCSLWYGLLETKGLDDPNVILGIEL